MTNETNTEQFKQWWRASEMGGGGLPVEVASRAWNAALRTASQGEGKPVYQYRDSYGAWRDTTEVHFNSDSKLDKRVLWTATPASASEAVPQRPQFIVDRMVSAFLSWRLPQDFAPDAGIAFTPLSHPAHWPSGTNLMNADQARSMVLHMLGSARSRDGRYTEEEGDAFTDGYFTGADEAQAHPAPAPASGEPAYDRELVEDAERYRWLRSQDIGHCEIDRTLFETIHDDCNPPFRSMKHGTSLDTAIDAARAADNRDAAGVRTGKRECETCNGNGLVGGFVNADSGYQDDPCPDCNPANGEGKQGDALKLLNDLRLKWVSSVGGKPSSRAIETVATMGGLTMRGDNDYDNEVWAIRKCASELDAVIAKLAEQQRAGVPVAEVTGYRDGGSAILRWMGKPMPVGSVLLAATQPQEGA